MLCIFIFIVMSWKQTTSGPTSELGEEQEKNVSFRSGKKPPENYSLGKHTRASRDGIPNPHGCSGPGPNFIALLTGKQIFVLTIAEMLLKHKSISQVNPFASEAVYTRNFF